MQRAEIAMMVRARKAVDMLKLIDKMEECFSAVPTEKMKRVEEAKKILEAQDHARFAEDLVRECARRFPNSVYIRARCFESIHAHDAIAEPQQVQYLGRAGNERYDAWGWRHVGSLTGRERPLKPEGGGGRPQAVGWRQ